MKRYKKPFLSLDDQITLLTSRGLGISDPVFAKDCLKNIGYYRLSGYWYPMRESQSVTNSDGSTSIVVLDSFRQGATFEQIIDIYTFDRELRLLLLDILERIEIAIRNDVILQLGQYSPWAYRDPAFFNPKFSAAILPGQTKTRFAEFISDFDTKTVPRSKADFVQHFRSTYSDPLPLWAAVELWDFGTLGVVFSGMKVQDQRAIASRYGFTKPDILPSWIRTFAHIRNICAHHSRLWNKPPVAQPKVPAAKDAPELAHLHQDRYASQRLYAVLAIARYMQKIINSKSSWGQRLIDHTITFPHAPGISLRHMGYVNNWEQLPLWQ